MSNTVIKLEDVWKIYKMDDVEVPALRGLSLEIKEKEFVAIMGPSGSGKSTALNMVGCLDTPTKGKIFLNSYNIADMDESHLAQIRGKEIGFIFQTFNLLPSLNSLENVELPMIFQGVHISEREKRAKELLKQVGLEDRMFHKPSELSGGQRQRVAVARALVNNPRVILADEPTGNLDSVSGKEIMEMLKNLNEKEKKTIVLITHDSELAEYSQRIIHLKDGRATK